MRALEIMVGLSLFTGMAFAECIPLCVSCIGIAYLCGFICAWNLKRGGRRK